MKWIPAPSVIQDNSEAQKPLPVNVSQDTTITKEHLLIAIIAPPIVKIGNIIKKTPIYIIIFIFLVKTRRNVTNVMKDSEELRTILQKLVTVCMGIKKILRQNYA